MTGASFAAELVHPVPMGLEPSAHYRVQVSADGRHWQESFVHQTNAQLETNASRTVSWSSLICPGPLAVRVRPRGRDVSSCRVLPSSLGIAVELVDGEARLSLPRPCQVSVEFDDDTTHAMLLFADPPEEDVPAASDEVIVFEPGVHRLDQPLELHSGQTLYLAGGAYVYGNVVSHAARGIRIRGRGVLSGALLPNPNTTELPEDYDELREVLPTLIHFKSLWDAQRYSADNSVEGITLVDAPRDNLIFDGQHGRVSRVKMISWFFRTDAVMGGRQLRIEDCFFKVNDDCIKLYKSGTEARGCVIWQMENGAPFQLGWNTRRDQHGFLAEDCDVIHAEHRWGTEQSAIFSAIHGGAGHLSGYEFRDIRIENLSWRLLNLRMLRTRYAKDEGWGGISDIVFRDIEVRGEQRLPSRIDGHSPEHRIDDVRFERLRINGEPVERRGDIWIDIDPRTTSGIRFE